MTRFPVARAGALIGGGLPATGFTTGQTTTQADFLVDSTFTNMAAPGLGGVNPGQLSLILMNDAMTKFLNLEISALQADGKGKIISSPRVITADNVEALIEQGTRKFLISRPRAAVRPACPSARRP